MISAICFPDDFLTLLSWKDRDTFRNGLKKPFPLNKYSIHPFTLIRSLTESTDDASGNTMDEGVSIALNNIFKFEVVSIFNTSKYRLAHETNVSTLK